MRRALSILTLVAVSLTASLAVAASPLEDRVAARVRAQVPADWQVRVRMREHTLVAFLMPPINQAFDLLYQPKGEADLAQKLCPPMTDPIWRDVGEADIAIEPEVMGKGALRISCRATAAEAKNS